MNKFFIGVDVGSGSARAGVFDETGSRLGMAVHEIKQFRPKSDFVEQSSVDIWNQVCKAVNSALKESNLSPDQISGIGFDATCSLVAIDEKDQPVSVSPTLNNDQNIIMWMDHRAIKQATEINKTKDPVLKYVGGEVSPEMELPKILWLKQNLPDQYKKTAQFFDLPDYLVYRATGIPTRSICTKSCKWNYLSHEQAWPEEMLDKIDLLDLIKSNKLLGEIKQLGTSAGNLSELAAKDLGLTTKTIVATAVIDAHAGGLAIIGAEPESTLAIIGGTSSCHMALSKKERFVPGVWGPYLDAMLPNYWLLEGGQSAAGSLIDHVMRDSAAYPLLLEEAASKGKSIYEILNVRVLKLEENSPQLTENFHLLGYHHGNRSPRANPTLKGMISGLSLNETIDELAIHYLAAIQSVAYGTRHIIDEMAKQGHHISLINMCGGGVKNPLWLREHADITGCDICLPDATEAVLLGSAMLAAAACKAFSTLEGAIASMSAVGERIRAMADKKAFHDAKYQVFLEMYNDQVKYKTMMAKVTNK